MRGDRVDRQTRRNILRECFYPVLRTTTQFHGNVLQPRINALHGRNKGVIHVDVVGWGQVVIDARLVIDTPVSDYVVWISWRDVGTVGVGESARVVILDQVLGISGELSESRIIEAIATVIIDVQERRRLRDLEFRAVVADP